MELEDLLNRLTLADSHLVTLLNTALTHSSDRSLPTLIHSLRSLSDTLPSLSLDAVLGYLSDVASVLRALNTARERVLEISAEVDKEEGEGELRVALKEWLDTLEWLVRRCVEVRDRLAGRRDELRICRGVEQMQV